MERVTVVTIYYNREALVSRTLDSLERQSYSDFKVIAVDDGSTDETYDNLLNYESANVKVRSQRNIGFTQTIRNVVDGIDSEYVAIQGSGDVSMPDRLSEQVECLDSNPDVMAVGCWVQNVNALTGETKCLRPALHSFDAKDMLQANPFTHGEVMFRRSAYMAAGGCRVFFKYSQDRDLWNRMSRLGCLKVIDKVLYERTIQADGVGANVRKRLQQAALSEIGLCCHREVLRGNQDLIERAGGLASAYISPSISSYRRLCRVALVSFKQTKDPQSFSELVILSKIFCRCPIRAKVLDVCAKVNPRLLRLNLELLEKLKSFFRGQ